LHSHVLVSQSVIVWFALDRNLVLGSRETRISNTEEATVTRSPANRTPNRIASGVTVRMISQDIHDLSALI